MAERLRPTGEYCEIFGNENLRTPFGLLNVNVQPSFLKKELIAVTESRYPDNPKARQTGQERAGRLVCVFGGGLLLKDVLIARLGKGVDCQRCLVADHDVITASSFVNPADEKEFIFYFNLPHLIQARGITTYTDFLDNFRTTWVHERYHFAQFADTQGFEERMAHDKQLVDTLVLTYVLGVPTATIFAGFMVASKISRRAFLKNIGSIAGLVVGAKFVSDHFGQVGYNFEYNILPTLEHEAVDVAERTKYSLTDLKQTFQFSLTR